ncbi:MAG: chitinase [Clostridia bacterium]|nr:chitinase [Clostridia bacterium]
MEKLKNTHSNKSRRFVFSKNWLKTWVPVISVATLFVLSVIIIVITPVIEYSLIGGTDKTSKSGFPRRMVAPFVDMTSWIDPASAYSINGAPNLVKFAEDTSINTYCLGFINPVQSNPTASNGKINWAWGGYSGLEKGSTNSQYLGIVQSIENLKNSGGKVVVSVGGQAGNAPWKISQSEDRLAEMYEDIIETYSLTRLDLDIEEDNQDYDQNVINAKAIKKVQDKTGVEIVLTIPIMPSGWQQKQLNLIKAYAENGVDICLFNSMCMCYGTGVNSGEDYGDASVRAIENSVAQLQNIYSGYGIDLSETQAYLKTGCTVSIGYESSLYPTFTTSMMQKVSAHAKQKNYAMLSFWSMGRDSKIESNSGISNKYAYTAIAKEYLQES